ncbi:MAG: HAD family hydrolase [bacterium]|nr:HAD family hydrolase [bacterium]
MKAVFLDRDGTINREVNVLRDVRQLRLLPGAAKAIKKLNQLRLLVVVITNQPVIARGWLTEKEVEYIHDVLIRRLAKRGAKIDAIYYCPHHPNANLKKYRIRCRCRKPGIGMIQKAVREFGIDPRASWVIGDSGRDVAAGKKAGVRTILVATGYGGKDIDYGAKPDFVARNLQAAVRIITRHAK